MWKCATRRVKSILCKSNCNWNNVASTRSARNDRRPTGAQLRPSPMLLLDGARGRRGTHNGEFPRDERGGEKEDPRTDRGRCLHDFHNDLFGALRLSGIFVIGWYLLQPFSHRKAVLNRQPSEKCAFGILARYTHTQYNKIVDYLRGSISPFNCILPEVKANRSKNRGSDKDSETRDWNFDELERAHKKVVGAISNQMGAECMRGGRLSEAFAHFSEGARVNNPSAVFNLALCHEMGFGTDRDFKKAAEMYRRASELGHAAATYNLGVFYARGLGDLEPDANEARKLFESAAGLGQRDARAALDMESGGGGGASRFAAKPEILPKVTTTTTTTTLRKPFAKVKKEDSEGSSSEDSGAVDLSPRDRRGLLLT